MSLARPLLQAKSITSKSLKEMLIEVEVGYLVGRFLRAGFDSFSASFAMSAVAEPI